MPRKKTISYNSKRYRRVWSAVSSSRIEEEEQQRPRKYIYFLFSFSIFISIALIVFSFFVARENHKKQQRTFSLDNISVNETEPLVANFVEPNKQQDFTFDFTVTNNTKYDYPISVGGVVIENKSSLDESEEFGVEAGETRDISVTIPLAFPSDYKGELDESHGAEFSLQLELSTIVAKDNLLGPLAKSLQKEFPITLKLAADTDLAKLAIKPDTGQISYSPNSQVDLPYVLNINNKVNVKHDFAIYEVFLLDSNKQVLQPLVAKDISLKAGESKEIEEKFTFRLPPANQLNPGSQDYYLLVKYSGRIGNRTFELEQKSEQGFKIVVL